MDKLQSYEVDQLRAHYLKMYPDAPFDTPFHFFYDETNNFRKFYLKESGFNYSPDNNFVLGGLVYEGTQPDLKELFNGLKLQSSIKEVKLNHLTKGEFPKCLDSIRLFHFLSQLWNLPVYIHYSTYNVFYYAIVDIVDSAIVNLPYALQLGPSFAFQLKNDLYKLCKLERGRVVELFYSYQYPNIKSDKVIAFIEDLTSLFKGYEDRFEFHTGLTALKQILKESKSIEKLPFLTGSTDYILMKDFAESYRKPLYLYVNSHHTFDNEESIKDILQSRLIHYKGKKLDNHEFVPSENSLYIQASDIFIGLVGRLFTFLNTHTHSDILELGNYLTDLQKKNLALYFDLVDKSESRNRYFLHNIASYDDLEKMEELYKIRLLYC